MREFSAEHKKKLSEAQKRNPNRYWLGKKRSQEDVEKFRRSHYGKKQSPETIKKRIRSGEQHYRWGKGKRDSRTRRKYAPRPVPDNCEACGIEAKNLTRGLFLDHNHATDEFRGWICTRCNVALGMVNDNVDVLYRLIAYVSK